MFKIIDILLISVILMSYHQEIAGVCCGSVETVEVYCDSNDGAICSRRICDDGTIVTPYCGYGACNAFGCACAGGCRRGSTGETPRQIFKRTHSHFRLVE